MTTAVKQVCDECGGSLDFSSWHYADIVLCGQCNAARTRKPDTLTFEVSFRSNAGKGTFKRAARGSADRT